MVDISIQFAVKGKKTDIADLFKRLTAMQNEGNVKFDYRTICLSKMIVDDCEGVDSLEQVSPSCLTFRLIGYSYGWYLKSIRQALRDAYPEADIYFRLYVEDRDYPFAYDPEQLLIDKEYYYEIDSDFDPRDSESWPDEDALVVEADDDDAWYSLNNEEYGYVIEYEATYVDGIVISGSFGQRHDCGFGDWNGKEVFLNFLDLDYTYLNGIHYKDHVDDNLIVWAVTLESNAIRLGIEKSDFDCYGDWCEAVERRINEVGDISTIKLVCTDKDAGSSTTTVIHTVHEFKKNTPLRFAYETEVGGNRYAGKLELGYDEDDDDYSSAEAAFFLKDVEGKEIKASDSRYERFFDSDCYDPVGRIYDAIIEVTGLYEEIKAIRLSYISGGC